MSFHFENKINSLILENGMITPGDSVLVAVSGGSDSMCLVHVLHQLKYRLAVAHVNFQLRGIESDLDLALVKQWCMEREIPFHSIALDTIGEATKAQKGIQETARILRYTWFEELCVEFHYHKIAVAHHQDDQAETVLFNLIRGSGIQGARGIPGQQGKIIRPFITVPKNELLEYGTQNKIPFREDQSNPKTEYTRNQIRHLVLPAMTRINPNAAEHIAQFGMRVQSMLPGFLAWKKNQKAQYLIPHAEGYKVLNPRSIGKDTWYVLLEEFGFNENQINQLHQCIQTRSVGKQFLSNQFQLNYTGEYVEIRHTSAPNQLISIQIDYLPFKYNSGIKEFKFEWDAIEAPEQSATWQLDLTHYPLPLTLRTWLPGDRFTPLGMEGRSKKIQDYLTDLKVSGFEKKQAMVLLSRGEILWVWPDGRISEQVKTTVDRSNVLCISMQDNGALINESPVEP